MSINPAPRVLVVASRGDAQFNRKKRGHMWRWTLGILLAVIGLSDSCLAQVTYYAPHVISGWSSDMKSSWHTEFDFINESATQTANLTVNLTTNDGQPYEILPPGPNLTLVSTVSGGISPLGRLSFTTLLMGIQPYPVIPQQTGWASVQSNVPLRGIALLVEQDSVGQIINSVTFPLVQSLSSDILVPVGSTVGLAPINGVAILNPSMSATASVTLELLDGQGGVLEQTAIDIPPQNKVATFINQWFPDIVQGTNSFVLHTSIMRIQSTQQVAVNVMDIRNVAWISDAPANVGP